MPKENRTKYVILGLLNHEDLTGYDIKKQVENNLSNFWDISYGQIYPELKKLENYKFISCRIDNSENGSLKKIYSITETGRTELISWLESSTRDERIKFEFLLKLYFSAEIKKDITIKNIDDFIDRHSNKIKLYEKFDSNLSAALDNKDHKYRYLTLLFGIYMEEAFVKWGNEAKTFLENVDD
ncbi:MAG: PadR family transcriptional regulator [Spirochaetales bacterium]|nr:PadR family transcriptional regulator [Spirochaetales bacterium]